MTDPDTRERFRFFLEHAGWSTPPGRAACALEMARTERLLEAALDAEVAAVEWVDDFEPYDGGDAWTPEQVAAKFDSNEWTGPYGCVLKVDGETLASLWGIVLDSHGTGDPYARVVACELAAECEDDLRQALGDARDREMMPV